MDDALRDLERQMEKLGYGDVVRYVNAVRRASFSSFFETPVQSAPLWARFSVPGGGMTSDQVVVPGFQNYETSFEVIGVSVLFDVSTPKDVIARVVDGGVLVLTDMVGLRSDIPLRMAVAWPWPVDQPPGASMPAMRRTGLLRRHEHMVFEIVAGGSGGGQDLTGTFVLHGVRRGVWADLLDSQEVPEQSG